MSFIPLDPDLAGIMAAMGISWVVIAIIIFVSLWKIFQKAGRPGWEGIIPLYNYYILLVEVVGRPAWWIAFPIAAIVLGWVPIIGWLISIAFLVVHIIVSNDLSKDIAIVDDLSNGKKFEEYREKWDAVNRFDLETNFPLFFECFASELSIN